MKKIFGTIFILMLAGGVIYGQKKVKTANAVSVPKQTVEREKFDPMRNADTDLQQAVARAQAEEKRIILDVGGEWCGWCRYMDNFFIQNPELLKFRDENFIWVKVNYSGENKNDAFLAKYPEIAGFPHLFVLEKDGTLLQSQKTVELEGEKSYNLQKFTDFLKKWAKPKVTG